MKYTKEILAPLVASSFSFYEVMRKLGIRMTGGSHANLKLLTTRYGLSTAHFLGKGSNRGADHRGGPARKTVDEILVVHSKLRYKEPAFRLRRALIESGRKEVCEECKVAPIWNGKPLTLQVDHKNGCNWDNLSSNLRFLCPNCHSQTDNFGSKNKS